MKNKVNRSDYLKQYGLKNKERIKKYRTSKRIY